MKISIVTISFNQARFLEQAIRSVVEQNYPDIEYIVVDPGSTDGSRDIIEQYRDGIQKIIFEPDNGPADGLNRAFAQATGEIYAFINSDDFFLPGSFRIVTEAFLQAPHKDVLSGHSLIVDSTNNIINRLFSRRYTPLRSVYNSAVLAQQSTFFRSRAYWKINGFNVSNCVAWDGELWMDLAMSGAKFGRINEFLSAFRITEDSITGAGKFKDEYLSYKKRMFEKVRGRAQCSMDKLIRSGFKSVEYIENPLALMERLLKGPIV